MPHKKLSLKDRLLDTYIFFQLYYAAREIWWGIAANYLNFNLKQLDKLVKEITPASLIALGLLGAIGALTKSYYCNLIFASLNVFVFACIALIFFIFDSHSGGGGNYTLEMFGAIWLMYKVNKDNYSK